MSINLARVQMLRGNLSGHSRAVRPPWAVAEPDFFDLCSRCNACIDICPSKIISRGSGGFPELSFQRGECDFCAECSQACQSNALSYSDSTPPWLNVITINQQRCLPAQGVMCLSCAEQCESEAIQFKPTLGGISQPQLDLDCCTGCGACIAPCPSKAIEMKLFDIPQQQPSTGEHNQ